MELDFLIQWPSFAFANSLVTMLSSLIALNYSPSGAMDTVLTYSNYQHNQTVKYLIGIAPRGPVMSFRRVGGRTSDKHIVQKSGILSNLLPGDIIMADWGF